MFQGLIILPPLAPLKWGLVGKLLLIFSQLRVTATLIFLSLIFILLEAGREALHI